MTYDGKHALVIQGLISTLESALPANLTAVTDFGWKPENDEFAPDVIVVPREAAGQSRFTGTPPLVVEVVSSDRAIDLVVRFQKYATTGAPRYWVVDLPDGILAALALRDGIYEMITVLDSENPSADLDVAGVTVPVSLPQLLG
jgi:Uma2 family endonuclease